MPMISKVKLIYRRRGTLNNQEKQDEKRGYEDATKIIDILKEEFGSMLEQFKGL